MPEIEFNYTALYSFTATNGHSIRVDHENQGTGTIKVTDETTGVVMSSGSNEPHPYVDQVFLSEYADGTPVSYIATETFPYATRYYGEPDPDPTILTVSLDTRTKTSAPNLTDGTASFVVVGGTAPYSYSLDNVTWQASASFTGLSNGNHTLYVTDSATGTGQLVFTIETEPYTATVFKTFDCPVNYSGNSYLATGTGTSFTSMAEAQANALLDAQAQADANMVCTINLNFEDTTLIDDSLTYSYSVDGNFWAFEHDYVPDMYLSTDSRLASFTNGLLHLHNIKETPCVYYSGQPSQSFIDAVFSPRIESVLHNLMWNAAAYDVTGKAKHELTFDEVIIYNEDQCSGLVPLRKYKGLRDVHGIWRFNDFIDKVKDRDEPFMVDGRLQPTNIKLKSSWFNDSLFIGKFFIVRFIHHNLTGNNLYIYQVDATVSKSVR